MKTKEEIKVILANHLPDVWDWQLEEIASELLDRPVRDEPVSDLGYFSDN